MDLTDYSPLDAARDWLGRYLRTVHPSDLDLLALWAAHTHVVNEVYTTPRLLLDSPVPGSGKTTALEHLARLCVNPVQMAAVSSPALLARILEDGMRTLLIDEADRTLRPDKDGVADLIAMLNSGYKRGATRPVLVPVKGGGWAPREMPTFAPVALAGNNPTLPDDTRTRIIRVLLLPDINGTVEESDWELIEPYAAQLGEQLAAWADLHRVTIAETRPDMPPGIVGRFREKWQPLARVASVAGGRWPSVVADLAVQDREQVDLDREDGLITTRPHVVLVQHLAETWPTGETFVSTTTLVDTLALTYPEMWGDQSTYGKALTVQRFGRMLATAYKVNSRQRPDGNRARGYHVADLSSVWNSMGLGSPPETVRTVRTAPTVPASHGSTVSNTTNGSAGRPPKEPCTLVRPDGRTHQAEPMPHCWACERAAS